MFLNLIYFVMKKVILVVLINCFCLPFLFAQATDPLKIPQITPISPEAASLGRYGEVEVSDFTGAADISIPLHVIKSGELEYPLNLYYNATGVRVNQEATFVGLNWDLTAVAGIVYEPAGGNDQIDPAGFFWSSWKMVVDVIDPFRIYPATGHELWYLGSNDYNTPLECVEAATEGKGQRDMYSVNAPGISFKFYINPETGTPQVIGERNNCKVSVLDGGPNVGFLITDGKGIKYRFSAVEYAESLSHFRVNNAWYLSYITGTDGHWIKFTYTGFGPTQMIPPSSETTLDNVEAIGGMGSNPTGVGVSQRTLSRDVATINTQYLTKIESMTETVRFNLSGREDIAGSGARKLDSLIVEDNFSPRKKIIEFQHDYFSSSSVGGDYLTDGTFGGRGGLTDANLQKRLKLTGIVERNASGSEKTQYSFAYNEEVPLPMKTSFAKDHWGYYNGQENTSDVLHYGNSARTLVPRLFSAVLFNSYSPTFTLPKDVYSGANRGPSAQHMQSGMLKSIQYPTGGKTLYTFEPHTFSNYTILTADKEVLFNSDASFSLYDLNYPDGSAIQYTHSEFELTSSTDVHFQIHFHNKGGMFTYSQIASAYCNVLSVGPNGVQVVHHWAPDFFSDGQAYSKVFDEILTLPAGHYAVQLNVPDNLGFQGYTPLAEATINYKLYTSPQVPQNYESIGGGLRIKRVDNFDEHQNLLSSREYSYVNVGGGTSGLLQAPLNYIITENWLDIGGVVRCGSVYYKCFYRQSDGSFSTSTYPIGPTVGYSRVAIRDLDKTGASGNGMTIKEFSNDAHPLIFESTLVYAEASFTGKLLTTTYLNAAGDTLRIEKNVYSTLTGSLEKDWVNVTSKKIFVGEEEGREDCTSTRDQKYRIGVYPYVRFKNILIKKTEEVYSGSNKNTVVTEFDYNPSNYEISQTRTYNSKQELETATYKYPVDFMQNYPYSTMVSDDCHIIEPVIEETRLKNGVQLVRNRTNYFTVENSFIKPVSVEQQVKADATKVVLTYDHYTSGKIAQYQTKDGVIHSVIWGYNQTFPVAAIENAFLKDVFYTGFEDDAGSNVVSTESKTGRKSYKGSYSLNISNLSNGAYTLTYWTKTGTAINDWTLKTTKAIVTTNAYSININETGAIDDIRFLPEGALITTYTYDPLAGMTSSTDPNNVATYFEYDTLNRLKLVKDANKKVVKQTLYHYLNQQ